MVMYHVFVIKVYKIGLLFKQTLACDQRHGLLIASSYEKYWGCFTDSAVFDNVAAAIRITVDTLKGHVS